MINRICDEVAEHYGVTVAWFMSPKQSRTRARCRNMSMALVRELTAMSHEEIAEQFGLHYTSSLSAYRKLQGDSDFIAIKERLTA